MGFHAQIQEQVLFSRVNWLSPFEHSLLHVAPNYMQLLFSSIDFKWSFQSKLYKIQTLIASNVNNTLALSRTIKLKVPSGMPRQERDIRGYSIPQYRKKNWQIRNTVSKIDEVPIPYLWSVTLYPSRVFFFFFFYLKHVYTSTQPLVSLPEKTWDLELNGTTIGKPGHWMSHQFPDHRVTARNSVFIEC